MTVFHGAIVRDPHDAKVLIESGAAELPGKLNFACRTCGEVFETADEAHRKHSCGLTWIRSWRVKP